METNAGSLQELARLKRIEMNKYQILALKSIRRVYQILFIHENVVNPDCVHDEEIASKIIYDALTADQPCMISRFGSTELSCLINYLGVTQDKNKYCK